MPIARMQQAAAVAAFVLVAASAGCGGAERNDAVVDSARAGADTASPPSGFGPGTGTDTPPQLQVDTPSTGTPTDSAAPRDTTRDTTATG